MRHFRGIPLPLISTPVAGRGGEEGLVECREEGLLCRAHSRPRHQWKLWSREALQNCSQLGQRARLLDHGFNDTGRRCDQGKAFSLAEAKVGAEEVDPSQHLRGVSPLIPQGDLLGSPYGLLSRPV